MKVGLTLNQIHTRFQTLFWFGNTSLPHCVAGILATSIDKILLSMILNLKAVGIYAIGYSIELDKITESAIYLLSNLGSSSNYLIKS